MARTLQGRTIRGLAAGAAAGLATWLVVDRTGWFARLIDSTGGVTVGSHVYWLQGLVGGIFGMLVGCGAAAADFDVVKAPAERARTLVLCAVCGLTGGVAGMQIGNWAYNRIVGPMDEHSLAPSSGQLFAGLIARSAGWALVGAAIGASQGLARGSGRKASLGAVGGLMGGLSGGGVFEALEIGASNPNLARFAGFVFVGAAVGFFLEVMPVLLKQAWITIQVGRGAGNEYLLERRWTSFGRSETADVRLYGDPSVAPVHFLIESGPSLSLLRPASAAEMGEHAAPIRIGEKAVTSNTVLTGGERIEVGSFVLVFSLRPSASSRRTPTPQAASIPPPIPRRKSGPAPRPATSVRAPAPPLNPAEVGHVATARRVAQDGLSGSSLHATHGPYFEHIFALPPRDEIVIGRGPDCDIALMNDKSVSRRHCAIQLMSGRHWLVDLKSANGTLLNDVRVKPGGPFRLTRGDQIKLGDTVLVYE